MRACVRACVRACARVCVCVCVCSFVCFLLRQIFEAALTPQTMLHQQRLEAALSLENSLILLRYNNKSDAPFAADVMELRYPRTDVATDSFGLFGWLNWFNAELSPKRYWRDRDRRRWGKRETMPNATLSPPE